jgi:ubiquinone/menaquinone biosynthesis C-methylase UbiE
MKTFELSAEWKKFALSWSKVTSPGRPSKKERQIFAQQCRKVLSGGTKNALVFGATPELRDILAAHKNCRVHIADVNLEMAIAMTSLTQRKNPGEIWVISDWLKLPLRENFFDLMIADFTFENLPFAAQKKYFENIARWLKPGGYYLERTFLYQPDTKPVTIEELFEIYKNKKIDGKTVTLFWEIGVFFTNKELKSEEARVTDFAAKAAAGLKKLNPGDRAIISRYLKETFRALPRNKVWFPLRRNDYEKMVKKDFKIAGVFYGADVNMLPRHKDTCPIYLLKKK